MHPHPECDVVPPDPPLQSFEVPLPALPDPQPAEHSRLTYTGPIALLQPFTSPQLFGTILNEYFPKYNAFESSYATLIVFTLENANA